MLFPDESFAIVICNATIPHLDGETESGDTTVSGPRFENERTFYLYPPAELEQKLEELGFQRKRSVPGNRSFDYEDGKGVECRTLYLRKTS